MAGGGAMVRAPNEEACGWSMESCKEAKRRKRIEIEKRAVVFSS